MKAGRSMAYAPSGEHVAVVSYTHLVLWNIKAERIECDGDVKRGFRTFFNADAMQTVNRAGRNAKTLKLHGGVACAR